MRPGAAGKDARAQWASQHKAVERLSAGPTPGSPGGGAECGKEAARLGSTHAGHTPQETLIRTGTIRAIFELWCVQVCVSRPQHAAGRASPHACMHACAWWHIGGRPGRDAPFTLHAQWWPRCDGATSSTRDARARMRHACWQALTRPNHRCMKCGVDKPTEWQCGEGEKQAAACLRPVAPQPAKAKALSG